MAAIYARVSTEDQADGYSLPTQIEACQKLAEREGWAVPEAYLFPEDHTGTVLRRPVLNKVRELAQQHAIQAIIVYDPDRLARRFALQMILDEEFRQAGVDLRFVTHQVEESPEGMLFFHMRGALAEYEREKFMERARRGRLGRAKAGNPWGGQVPLGYRAIREPHIARWEIDDEEAALVRRIFLMCLSGMTTYAIALQLSRERVRTRGNGRRILQPGVWQASSVHRLLTNEAYAGRTYFGKYQRTGKTTRRLRPREEWVAIAVPVIVDEATFQAVQRQLARNRELSPRNKKREYLLSGGYLRCGRCGRAMTGGAYRDTRRYHCSSIGQVLDPEGRCYGQLKADDVEPQVWAAVVRVLEQPELIAAEVARQESRADEQRAEIARDLAFIEAALARCEQEDRRLIDAYTAGAFTPAELKAYRAEVNARRQSYLTEQAACQGKLDAIGQAVGQVEALTEYCRRVRQRLQTFDHAEKRVALEALDIRVTWVPGQPLRIDGSIPMGTIAPMPC
jgi:site-specific DNA recombinase